MIYGENSASNQGGWSDFLEMLSVERTEPFLRELSVPFKRDQFPKIMRLARACLEVMVAREVSIVKDESKQSDLVEAWRHYREAAGVLGNETILKLLNQHGNSDSAIEAVYSTSQFWIGASLAESLKKWFMENFRTAPDPAWQWPWALRLLLIENKGPAGLTNSVPLSEEGQQCVKSFCVRYGSKKRDLEMRFWVIKQAATATLPSAWESVLQSFPEDGLGNHYPWLGYIEECLQYRLIRKEWSKLSKEIGSETMENLVHWVKEVEKYLPYDTILPSAPTSLTNIR